MAGKLLDPKELKTWEEAFHVPVPATRHVERQLRSELVAGGEKLRRLVGSALRMQSQLIVVAEASRTGQAIGICLGPQKRS